MTTRPATQAAVQPVSPTVRVDFDIVETISYRGTVKIDPTAFLVATGIEVHRATGAEPRDYAVNADVDHEECRAEVQGQERTGPQVEGMPSERNRYDLEALRQQDVRTRVLVDPVRYEQATGKSLVHQPWDINGLKRYCVEYPEQVEVASEAVVEREPYIHGVHREG